jgi:hypothetical protein
MDVVDDLEDHFSQTVGTIADQYIVRFLNNLGRSQGLVELYQQTLASSGVHSAHGAPDDVLRAAVVFMHASLEELLRQLALNLLSHASESALDEIPLAGLRSSGRPEKFLLGKLKQHDAKTVRELIEDSIREHLAGSNFNNVREISKLLRALELESEDAKNVYPTIADMIDRRHQIVHRADNVAITTGVETRPIEAETVLKWQQALVDFMIAIGGPAIVKHLVRKGAIERNADGQIKIRGLPGYYNEAKTP